MRRECYVYGAFIPAIWLAASVWLWREESQVIVMHFEKALFAHFYSDWYTMFHNPTLHFVKTVRCTSEAVWPL